MKRGQPMRRTPLPRRSSTLKPKKPMARGSKAAKPRPVPNLKTSDEELWRELRAQLWTRSAGRCELGGCDLNRTGMHAHHRLLRSQGGGHLIENLAALCPAHHNEGDDAVHSKVTWAREHGFIVPSQYDPAAWAMILHDGRTVRLTSTGGYDTIFPAPPTPQEHP